ncbi:MAG: hypothetical protein ABFD64_05750 [Armatimonadota bacterium]
MLNWELIMVCLRAKDNRGTSLVEVLVVLIVLVVGILTVVRLYPPGFRSVRHAEHVTLAGRLAQFEMERWKNNSENLPDGVLPIDSSGVVLNDCFPGPPVGDDNATSFRRIIGETVRIPFGGWSTGPLSGSTYVLSFSPIDTTHGGIVIKGSNLSRRVMDSDDNTEPWKFLRSSQYAIDYDNLSVCFRESSQTHIYYLSCSWWETPNGSSNPHLRTVTNIKIEVPGGTEGWINFGPAIQDRMASGASYAGIDRYSDTVARGFSEVTSWSSDPYEYMMVDPLLGIISFNPIGYSQQEFGRPLKARIDYDILDLEIIHEDKRVPTNAPYRVHMTLNHIKESGVSMELNGEPYAGLNPRFSVPGPNGTKFVPDMIAVDLESGRQIAFDSEWVDYENGTVDLPENIELFGTGGNSNVTISPAGRNIRFYYKAEGDWSLQFQKAYVQYDRDYNSGQLDYKSYAIDESNNPQRLWLAACNACHTISVDYEYALNGQTRRVLGECHKTSDALLRYGGIDSTYIDLSNEPTRILSVNGVSVRARVIWRETEKWRHVDLDSIIAKKSSD